MFDYEDVKDELVVELVGANQWAKIPSNTAALSVEDDMVLICKIVLETNDEYRRSAFVTTDMLDAWGIDVLQLHQDAAKNAMYFNPAKIFTLADALGIEPEVAVESGMADIIVVTTEDQIKGAAALFYPGVMDRLAGKVDGDYYVLPSSIHEVLVYPNRGDRTADDLQGMIGYVNATEVSPEDQLSDKAYHYDSKNRIFELAESFEARKQLENETQNKADIKKRKSHGR